MVYNELLVLLSGHFACDELTILSYHDVGMNFPEDGISVSKDFLEKNPQAWRDGQAPPSAGSGLCSYIRASLWPRGVLNSLRASGPRQRYPRSRAEQNALPTAKACSRSASAGSQRVLSPSFTTSNPAFARRSPSSFTLSPLQP